MKAKFLFLVMLALVLVLGLAFVGCNNDTTVDEIYGCAYSESEVSSDNTNTHYLLSISYNDALTKLNDIFGAANAIPSTSYSWGFSSLAWVEGNVVIEDSSQAVTLHQVINGSPRGVWFMK